jgi:hypothetical protein
METTKLLPDCDLSGLSPFVRGKIIVPALLMGVVNGIMAMPNTKLDPVYICAVFTL